MKIKISSADSCGFVDLERLVMPIWLATADCLSLLSNEAKPIGNFIENESKRIIFLPRKKLFFI